jgi:ABC-2 type transport system permease protein
MSSAAAVEDRRAGTTVAWSTGRRALRSGALWGALFGLLVWNEAVGYHANFPTTAARQSFAHTIGASPALAAVIGPARNVDTIGGFVAWRMFGLLIIVGAVWGLLTATRLLRGEEDAGRWELLLAGRTSRRHAAGQAIGGLALGFVALWAFTAALTVAAGVRSSVGFPASASLFYATAGTASAAIFLSIGALTSQLSATRREANGLAALVFAAAYLVRMVADFRSGLGWLRWASPLGWVENLSPLTGSRPLALVPITLLVASTTWAAVIVAGRRDVGAGVLDRPGAASAGTRWLGGPGGLVVQLERWVAVSWLVGLGLLAIVFGVVARSAGEANVGVGTVQQAVNRLGGHAASGATVWIGYEFLYVAALVAFAAAGQVSAMRGEEGEAYLDNLLARPVSRRRWLAGRLAFASVFVVAAGVAAGVGAWLGVASRHGDLGLATMVGAGVNAAAPALVVVGVGTLLYGLAPRLAVPVLYGLVLWSFVIEIIGSSITTNHWLLDTALLSHLGPVPATSLDWTAIGWLAGLGVLAAVAGLALFERRDLAAA